MTCIRLPLSAWLLSLLAGGICYPQSSAMFRGHELHPKGNSPHRDGFSQLSGTDTGILFTNLLSQTQYTTNQIFLNGSGVAAGDVDGDGWCDLYFCSLAGKNSLYRNLGNWKFTDVTDEAGAAWPGVPCTGTAFADLDGDGSLDIVVNSIGGGTRVLLNDGKGHFKVSAILNEGKGGMSLALADVDGDGALDIYICNYRTTTLRDAPGTNFRINIIDGKPVVAFVNGESTTLPKFEGRFALNASRNISEFGEADALYKNDGHGHFTLIPFTGGSFLNADGKPLQKPPYDWSLSAMFRDLNGDSLPDLYVCNDFDSPDCIWINQGSGVFKAADKTMLRSTSKFSMGIDFADINRDGWDDFLVLDMLSKHRVTRLTRADKLMEVTPIGVSSNCPQVLRNTLQLNRGDGTFAEIASFAGLDASEWSWTPIFLDVDLDGFEDLLVTAGHGRDDMDIDNGLRVERTRRSQKMSPADELALRKITPAIPAPIQAFRNGGNLRFEEMGARWGFNQVGISHGMCLADLDNDGDLDVVINSLNGPAGLYRNESDAPRVAVRLKGCGENTRGIGAKIKLFDGAVPVQSQEMICGGRYLSSDDAMRVFAAGSVTNDMRVEVVWRSGRQSLVGQIRANTAYEISEVGAVDLKPPTSVQQKFLFEDLSAMLSHQHHEEPFDDFAQQGLLPNRLSQLGPGVSWIDLDGDGWDDLVIGSGRGGVLGIFHNDGQGKLTAWSHAPFDQKVGRDQTTLLEMPVSGNGILAGSSRYEDGLTNGASVLQYDSPRNQLLEVIPAQPSSTGPLALSDLDGKGNMELFVGGRVVPGRYPEPATSLLYRYDGNWVLDETNSAVLKQVGLVSGALWTDLNGDGFPELVLACEWGPVRIFNNDKGRLREATEQWGMDGRIGWWNGVAAGDFDGDGKLDLIASNWGLNTKYHVEYGHGPRLYYGPWGGVGEIEIIEASFDRELNKWAPERDLNSVSRSIPWIREKFHLHRAYAEAGIDEILGDHFKKAQVLEATWLQTTVFLNRRDHFELGSLPNSAQFTPAFGINVADFDGDGYEDIFLSQNFFAVQPQTSRNDAGRGLLLKGNGRGAFATMDGAQSGIRIFGEQRGSAAADFDGDGRVDLVVSQNGAATTLLHNIGARPGLRVRLAGPARNPHAIGAVMRLGFEDKWGPSREVNCGSGYWSQNSLVQVLATPTVPTRIQIVWPGGRLTTSPLKESGKEVTVDFRTGSVSTK